MKLGVVGNQMRGGKRKGAGRPKGSLDKRQRAKSEEKATLEELARNHTQAALQTLVTIAETGQSESARVSAAQAILDRGYGKPSLAVTQEVGLANPLAALAAKLVGTTLRPKEHDA